MKDYSQTRAMLAITRASLRAIFRSPSAVIFSFVFPFIFILIFGFIGNGSMAPVYKIAIDSRTDTANLLYLMVRSSPRLQVVEYAREADLRSDLIKGRIAGVLHIRKNTEPSPEYIYSLQSTTASGDQWPQVLPIINELVNNINQVRFPDRPTFARADFNMQRDIESVRAYKTIDFILPGQLGFSLLSAGVFGVAFLFFNLRNTLVLKRFFATPIHRAYIVMGEGLARILFQLLTAVVIILVGHYFFGFTLVNGWITFGSMLLLSFLGLMVFMGFGFIISGLARNDSMIPPFANLVTLPQFLLGGTFFSVEAFPGWLQPVSRALPLTYLNTAMRKVAFEGQSIWMVRQEIGVLLLWGLIVYFIAVRVFRWE
jgi:ABC-2 type transport system permease protein